MTERAERTGGKSQGRRVAWWYRHVVDARHGRDALPKAHERLDLPHGSERRGSKGIGKAHAKTTGSQTLNRIPALRQNLRSLSNFTRSNRNDEQHDGAKHGAGLNRYITAVVAARVQLVEVRGVRRPVAQLAPRPAVAWLAVASPIDASVGTAAARTPVVTSFARPRLTCRGRVTPVAPCQVERLGCGVPRTVERQGVAALRTRGHGSVGARAVEALGTDCASRRSPRRALADVTSSALSGTAFWLILPWRAVRAATAPRHRLESARRARLAIVTTCGRLECPHIARLAACAIRLEASSTSAFTTGQRNPMLGACGTAGQDVQVMHIVVHQAHVEGAHPDHAKLHVVDAFAAIFWFVRRLWIA
eukprot:1690449-Prymnesium_polylepis.5